MSKRKQPSKLDKVVVPERSYRTKGEEREFRILKERLGIRDALIVEGAQSTGRERCTTEALGKV